MPLAILRGLLAGLCLVCSAAQAWQECLDLSGAEKFSCLGEFEAGESGNPDYETKLAEAAGEAGNYAYATVVLERLVQRHPEMVGARLDLVILSIRAGDKDTAARHLDIIRTLPDHPPVVSQLIRNLDQRLFAMRSAVSPPLAPWLRLTLAAGYDDNPNLGIEGEAIELVIDGVLIPFEPEGSMRPKASPYLQASADINHVYSPKGRVRAVFSGRQYEGLSDQDSISSAIQLEHRVAQGRYLRASLSDFRMRDGLYLTRAGAGGRQVFGECRCLSIGGYADVIDGSEKAYRGARGKLDFEAMRGRDAAALFFYGSAAYQRQPYATWGDTASILVGVDMMVDLPWGELKGSAGLSRYNSYDEDIYSPLFGSARRDLARNQARVGVFRKLAGGIDLYLDANYVDQKSDVPLYSYHRYNVELGVRFSFW